MENLFVILVLLLVGWLWLDMLRAREMAVAMAKRACERHDVQFLDQAVALRRLGLRWTNDGLRLRRQYRFEFSEEGTGRRNACLVLVGLRVETLDMGLPPTPEQPP
ncbi:MAG TPA: DUF3301 domain-containing protein [Chromatiaceae bacterium]|nr:MAG: DUF3301 domain-containing protein [Thiohalocapsa sp. PB-PSB1]HBG93917.1 DUF3301 domain-containing protein [Chromatiaceae bacterium]HCS89524.1 DUF3301 domain-containing protein [Chromatiaceae bacterium]